MKRGFSENNLFEPSKKFRWSMNSADVLKEKKVNERIFYSHYEIMKSIIYHCCFKRNNNLILNISDLSILDTSDIKNNLRRYEYEVIRSNGRLYYLRIMSPREIVEKILNDSAVYSNNYVFIYLISINLINKYTNIERFRRYIRNYDRRWIKLYFTESYVCIVIK